MFSARYKFNYEKVVASIIKILRRNGYPYELNEEKTRFGSVKGKNFNLGLMLNGDHNITVGHEAKRRYKATLFKMLKRIGQNDSEEKNHFLGLTSYYLAIEPEYFTNIIRRIGAKAAPRVWWTWCISSNHPGKTLHYLKINT